MRKCGNCSGICHQTTNGVTLLRISSVRMSWKSLTPTCHQRIVPPPLTMFQHQTRRMKPLLTQMWQSPDHQCHEALSSATFSSWSSVIFIHSMMSVAMIEKECTNCCVMEFVHADRFPPAPCQILLWKIVSIKSHCPSVAQRFSMLCPGVDIQLTKLTSYLPPLWQQKQKQFV